jgi:hypothetical protein
MFSGPTIKRLKAQTTIVDTVWSVNKINGAHQIMFYLKIMFLITKQTLFQFCWFINKKVNEIVFSFEWNSLDGRNRMRFRLSRTSALGGNHSRWTVGNLVNTILKYAES